MQQLISALKAALAPGVQRRRAVNSRAALRANARLVFPTGPTPPKALRFAAGATSNFALAPRGQGLYDAFACKPDHAILSQAVGPVTCVEAYARHVVTGSELLDGLEYYIGQHFGQGPNGEMSNTQAGVAYHPPVHGNSTLIAFNPGSSNDVVAKIFKLKKDDTNPTFAVIEETVIGATAFTELDMGPAYQIGQTFVKPDGGKQNQDQPTSAAGIHPNLDSATARIESIPLRGSLRIRNISESFAVGGEVRFLRYSGGLLLGQSMNNQVVESGQVVASSPGYLPDTMGVDEYLKICDMIRETKRAHTFTGKELTEPHQCNTHPADAIRSHTFQDDTTFFEACHRPKFCTLLVLIDDFASSGNVGNTYSLNMVVHRAGRFRPGTIHHNNAKDLPVNSGVSSSHANKESMGPPAKRLGRGFQDSFKYLNTQGAMTQ